MANNKEYKIKVSFDGHHVCSIWCEKFSITADSIEGYMGGTMVFAMFHDYTRRDFGGMRSWRVLYRDEILASSAQMTEAISPLDAMAIFDICVAMIKDMVPQE